MSEKEDFLEVDKPIPGQNYVCLSFVSPEKIVKQKELFVFHKYMESRYNILLESLEKTMGDISEDTKNKLHTDLKEDIRLALNFTYDQFSSSVDDINLVIPRK